MGHAGVGHAGHIVHLGHFTLFHLVPGHDLTVAVAHDLNVDPLVVGVGVTVVSPQEGADAHLVPGGGEGLPPSGGHLDNLAGAQLIGVVVAQLVIGKGLKGHAAAVLGLAHQHGQAAQPIPGGHNGVGGEDQDGAGAVDLRLGPVDAGYQVVLLIDEGGGQLGGVDLAGAHGQELVAVVGEIALHQRVGVVDDAHGGDGVQPQVGAHQQGLGVGVADAADGGTAVELGEILVELGAEGGVLDVVDLPLEAVLPVIDRHASPLGAQVGVVVGAEEHVQHAVMPGDRAEKSAHAYLSPIRRRMTSS